MRKLSFLLLLFLLFSALTLTASAHTTTVLDDGDLIDDDQERILESGCNCAYFNVNYYYVTRANASTYPSNNDMRRICGIAENEAAIVLLIRTYQSTYYYDMYTFGEAHSIFSDADVDEVLDAPDVYNNLKSGEIYAGMRAFTSHCHRIVGEHEQALEERQKRAPLTALLVGVILGVLAGGITVLCVFLYYRKKRHGESYPLDRYARLNLTQANDIFIGSHVTRVRVQSSSSGGGRSGGGGGGHRGGR